MSSVVRALHPGMGVAVAERTILRRKLTKEELERVGDEIHVSPKDPLYFDWLRAAEYSGVRVVDDPDAQPVEAPRTRFETWEEVADRVSLGNTLLTGWSAEDREGLRDHIAKGTILMSGRHLQHGDAQQPDRNQEVYTNCSTSATSFALFLLLLNGSGVGRDYSDDMILTDFDYAPQLRLVLDDHHPDFVFGRHESVRDARHKYGKGRKVRWHVVEDSREGWAKAVEIYEVMAFQKIHSDKTLILDFSKVRSSGSPIRGMQMRPASGPGPLMDALSNVASIKGLGLDPWLQAMYIDHYLAECVLVGGARRAARMSTKSWRDRNVVDFIEVKRPVEYSNLNPEEVVSFRQDWKDRFKRGETMMSNPPSFLWSSNNSILVDAEFWELVKANRDDVPKGKIGLWKHAQKVFQRLVECAYYDGTGEPGVINADKLEENRENWNYESVSFVGSKKFQVEKDTRVYLSLLAQQAQSRKLTMVVNPCFTGDTLVAVADGRNAVPISELTEEDRFPVYSARRSLRPKNGRQWKTEVKWARAFKTGVKPILQINLSDGSSFRCTADHRLALKEGGYIEAQHSAGKMLEPFYSVRHKRNYRIINSFTNGLAYQHRLIWEFFNGLKPKGYHIDHVVSNGYDGIENLQLLTASDHNAKTGRERLGELNPVHRIEDRDKWLLRLSRASFYTNNPREINPKIPQFFSKNRFKGDINHLIDIVEGRTEYEAPEILEDVVDEQKNTGPVLVSVTEVINTGDVEEVFDLNVEDNHNFYIITDGDSSCIESRGVLVHNCGEIALSSLGGYCVIADVVPFHSDSIEEAEDAFRHATRALIRVNTMDSLYKREVDRTNRIGVGMTGVHEFAWKFFKVGFRTLVNPDFPSYFVDKERGKPLQSSSDARVRAAAFWMTLSRFARAVADEAEKYSAKLGRVTPHTSRTTKPAGTTSKLFGLSEGWHLPAYAEYMRWVQFKADDPLVETYRSLGYPVKDNLKTYKGMVIVGFPTAPTITNLGMGDEMVLAGEASPEDQYKWLALGERYYIDGVTEDGEPLDDHHGNQISYTLKYKPEETSFEKFRETLLEYQSQIKCCSVMPQEDSSAHEYLPEQALTKAEYEQVMRSIQGSVKEDVDFEHVDCESGACPIDFYKANG